jgi:hypothetical protein
MYKYNTLIFFALKGYVGRQQLLLKSPGQPTAIGNGHSREFTRSEQRVAATAKQ